MENLEKIAALEKEIWKKPEESLKKFAGKIELIEKYRPKLQPQYMTGHYQSNIR